MRKKLLFLVIASLAALAVLTAACGDDDDDAGDDGGGATATATTGGGATTAAAGSPTTDGDDGGDEAQPLDLTVTASGFAFDIGDIEAVPGQQVNITLVNEDSAEHSFTIGDEDVTEAEGGEEGEGTFTASEETTEFHCKYHPQMTGTITVSEDAAADTSGNGGGGSISGVGY